MGQKHNKKMSVIYPPLLLLALSACGNRTGQPSDLSQDQADQQPVMTEQENSDAAAEDTDVILNSDDLAFPLGFEINNESFIGTVYMTPMITEDEIYHFPATNNIIFEPGARSNWHSHGGMIILVTGGVGYYQEEGQPAQIIREGDVVECAAGVRHWHGAAPNSWFSQMVIYDASYSCPRTTPPAPR